MTDESFKIIGWCRDKRFADHYSEGETRPKNATGDPNEWSPVISNDDYNRLTDLIDENTQMKKRLSVDPQGGDWIDVLEDRVEGLQADLDSAIEVAYKRGATEWVCLNYPEHYKRLSQQELVDTIELVQGLVDQRVNQQQSRLDAWDRIKKRLLNESRP